MLHVSKIEGEQVRVTGPFGTVEAEVDEVIHFGGDYSIRLTDTVFVPSGIKIGSMKLRRRHIDKMEVINPDLDSDSEYDSDDDIDNKDETGERYVQVAFQKLQTIKFPSKEQNKVRDSKLCAIGILIGQMVSIKTKKATYKGIIHKFGRNKIVLQDAKDIKIRGLTFESLDFTRKEIEEFKFLWGPHDPEGDLAGLDEEMQKLGSPESNELWQCENPNCYEFNHCATTKCSNCKLPKNYKDVKSTSISAGPQKVCTGRQCAVTTKCPVLKEAKSRISSWRGGHINLRKAVFTKVGLNRLAFGC